MSVSKVRFESWLKPGSIPSVRAVWLLRVPIVSVALPKSMFVIRVDVHISLKSSASFKKLIRVLSLTGSFCRALLIDVMSCCLRR